MPEGRYLLGLEPAENTASFLARGARWTVDPGAIQARCTAAEAARIARGAPAQTLRPCPPSFAVHLSQVEARPLFQALFHAYSTELCLVDLARLVPVQPHVDFSFAIETIPEHPTDQQVLDSCLPAGPQSFDVWGGVTEASGGGAFTLCSHDLNLIVSEVHMDADPIVSVRFTLSKTAIFLVVAEVEGRLFLKDGTHRAVGLLAHGVQMAPCVVIRSGASRPPIPDYLPRATLFGDHPPELRDFLDPNMYLAHPWTRGIKVIRIRSDEFVLPKDGTDVPEGGDFGAGLVRSDP